MSLKNHLSSSFGVFYLLIVCLLFRLLDIFVWKMDEKIGEIILSKTIGLILIILFLIFTNKSINYIHLRKINLKPSITLAFLLAILALLMCYSVKYIFLLSTKTEPVIAFNNQYTILSIFLFVFIGNLINTLMEEGLFRGLMIQTFINKMPFWVANLLQSIIFGLWHIPWIIKEYTTGKINMGTMLSNSLLYTLISGIMGFIMGYMVYRTKNLWTSITWHFVWNCTMNLFIIKTLSHSELYQISDILFWLMFLLFSALSIVITYYSTRRIERVVQ
ncbi:CAAX prenyl protease-like protein [Ureibacillus xyleni]|uniref:CAAX prenyl protease-like protein n=1 Tax=Ureibacillus xyleni TaxID=614648 RepID=A0A285RY40_9BACL|nr:CPBP family intramembrane glutamic endopeptidase [Ureibacillus xyleni]SOB99473.1 CAAX prenyl protease-like protein [Ureibacillus xyleni]